MSAYAPDFLISSPTTTALLEVEFTMIDKPHTIKAGFFMLMGQGVPHSVVAATDAKVMLVKIKA